MNFPTPQLRGAVPGLDLGDAWRREVRSSIPTLLVSGDLDVRTPLEEQAAAVRGRSADRRSSCNWPPSKQMAEQPGSSPRPNW